MFVQIIIQNLKKIHEIRMFDWIKTNDDVIIFCQIKIKIKKHCRKNKKNSIIIDIN